MTKEEYSKLIDKLEVDDYIITERTTIKDYEDEFRKLIENRLQHCEEQFRTNLQHAKSNGNIIVWNGGHFSYPTYEALVNSRKEAIEEWNGLVWEQIIRQMAREHCDNVIMYDIASEGCLCN